jgi:hypothetical protein
MAPDLVEEVPELLFGVRDLPIGRVRLCRLREILDPSWTRQRNRPLAGKLVGLQAALRNLRAPNIDGASD